MLKEFEGQVVGLDMVSGVQFTTIVKKVHDDGFVDVGKILVFAISPEPRNPTIPPHPQTNPIEHRVRNAPYGFPLFEVGPDTQLDCNHIIMCLKPTAEQVDVYNRQTSGIMTANEGMLKQLEGLDLDNLVGKNSS